MRAGFVGVGRVPLTREQLFRIRGVLSSLGAVTVVHGGARGSDEAVDQMAASLGLPREVVLSRTATRTRAETRPPGFTVVETTGAERRRLLSECDVVIACPGRGHETLGSEVWSVVRLARRASRTVYVFRG